VLTSGLCAPVAGTIIMALASMVILHAQNLLYEELDLSAEMNERISQEVSELIGSAFQ